MHDPQGDVLYKRELSIPLTMFHVNIEYYFTISLFFGRLIFVLNKLSLVGKMFSVRVSNELGRGSANAAKFAIKVAVFTSLLIGCALFIIFLFLRGRVAYIFTDNQDVIDTVADLSPLLSFSILLNSVQPVLSGNASLSCQCLSIFSKSPIEWEGPR